jgi:hypothetical protein
MRIIELEQKFQSEDTLSEVLTFIEDDMRVVDYWSNIRKTVFTNNAEEITKALNELSGAYANLRTALAVANTELTNREAKKRNTIKLEYDGKWTTQVNSAAKTEAIEATAGYRRLKNIIEAYKDSADKHISTLQSNLKDANKEFNHPQQG